MQRHAHWCTSWHSVSWNVPLNLAYTQEIINTYISIKTKSATLSTKKQPTSKFLLILLFSYHCKRQHFIWYALTKECFFGSISDSSTILSMCSASFYLYTWYTWLDLFSSEISSECRLLLRIYILKIYYYFLLANTLMFSW